MADDVIGALREEGLLDDAGYARRFGDSTSALARRVGPRRGAIALGSREVLPWRLLVLGAALALVLALGIRIDDFD